MLIRPHCSEGKTSVKKVAAEGVEDMKEEEKLRKEGKEKETIK